MNPDDVYMLDGRFGVGITSPHANIANTVANTATVSTVNKIQGEMFRVRRSFSQMALESMNKETIKREMIHDLVEELIKSESVEFTYLKEVHSEEVKITARIFATPNDNVQLLRKAGY